MYSKSLIITLIQQDLKHSQLTQTLRNIGLDHGGLYDLDLVSLVVKLMQVPPQNLEAFVEMYCSYLDRATQWPTSYHGKELLPVAEECYGRLQGCIE
ncbi:MAG: hypothetical protein AB3N18_03015 [Allomuricauda sp.]